MEPDQKQTDTPDADRAQAAGLRSPVVGIGASAGGIEALESFFRELEPSTGAAVIVLLHLDPTHPSILVQILGRVAQVPVREAEDGAALDPGNVYVVPPNAELRLEGRTLRLSAPRQPRHASIDAFLASLAEEQGEAAIGIVLSGAGSDGAIGLRAIKEHGGVTMAQDPEDARTDSMPRSAIALGSVDWILPARAMPAKIADYARALDTVPPVSLVATHTPAEDVEGGLRVILGLVLRKTGHDFTRYKQATMLRRVQRRMRIVQAGTLAMYAQAIRETPAEIDRLFADLLIGVTHFFRDPEVFAALAATVIPAILRGRGADAEVRIWVAGCATGEEAYSIAILLFEALAQLEIMPPVKIFATDIDEPALDFARQGRYPPSLAENMSAERLARFFRKVAGGYQVIKEVRDLCIFSTHNLVGDPPFSRLDLLSCRNLLIYLETETQKQLVPLFHYHYALAPGGYLLLGPSENLAAYSELFRTVDKERRLFQRQEAVVAPAVLFPLVGGRKIGRLERAEQVIAPLRAVGSEQNVTRAFERMLLEEYAPPAVMVNAEGKIVYVSGPTGRYLRLPSGMTRTNVVDMAVPALRPSLHTALHRAIQTGKPAIQEGLTVELEGALRRLDVLVRPIADAAAERGLFVIIFRETAPPQPASSAPPDAGPASDDGRQLAVDLERELQRTREHLQTTIEELESGSEELQSANEELLSTNEELQSANEELQTSKEEQQSVNEELQTVNVELVRKVEELDRVNSDLKNLFASTHIATVFLDGELRIKRFSPAATEIFRIIDSDVGRPITDIAAALADVDLVAEVRDVLATLTPRDREVRRADRDGWYLRRIRPYRSLENVIDGVVITLIDVTDLKQAQERIAALAAIVESSHDAILGLGLDGAITTWNAGAERLYGRAAAAAVGHPFAELCEPEAGPSLAAALSRAARGEHVEVADVPGVCPDGRPLDVLLTISPVRDAGGEVVALSTIAHDVTERRRAELALRRSESRFRGLSEAGVISVAFIDADGRIFDANDAFLVQFGCLRADVARGALLLERLARDGDGPQVATLVDEIWVSGRAAPRELDCVRRDGTRVVCLIGGACIEGGAEAVVFLLDVTERRGAVDDLSQSEERLRLAVEATMLGTWELDAVTGAIRCSARARALWGIGADEEVRYESRLARIHPDDRRAVDEATRRALDPTSTHEYRITYRTLPPGEPPRWIESWGRAFFSDAGGFRRAVRLIGTLLDVTERMETEEALKEVDRRKDRFLAVLGHELRNPLAPIRNAVHVLGTLGSDDPTLRRAREIIERQVRHMTHLLDDLLDVGRLASGKIVLRKERMDLVELVRAAAEEQTADAEALGLTLTVSLPGAPLWILADATRIEQSVTNLIVNAIKFTPSGGHLAVTVAPEAGSAQASAKVTVADDGMGVEPEMMARLFEPFSQADRSLDRSRGGLGLGLSLVRSFMEMHGGSVDVQSGGPGKGSTFTLHLPLEASGPVVTPAPEPVALPQRVLVVEDNEDAAESMAMMLELGGHTVLVAHNGTQGVDRARSFQPSIVLCDIGLPGGMDGYGVARALRADPALSDVRLIALTGYGQEDDKMRARDAGFDEHLTKPVAPETLERILAAGGNRAPVSHAEGPR